MIRETRRAGACLLLLGSVVAVLTLLAGPAGAQSGGAVAVDGSVASGEAHAARDSTASGESTATDGSTASGCSLADNESTASGDGNCGRTTATTRPGTATTPTTARPGTGTGAATAAPAATAGRLALTGSWSAPMTALALLAVVLGGLMVVAGSDRRATVRG